MAAIGGYYQLPLRGYPTSAINVDDLEKAFKINPKNPVTRHEDGELRVAFGRLFYLNLQPGAVATLYIPLQEEIDKCVKLATQMLSNFLKK